MSRSFSSSMVAVATSLALTAPPSLHAAVGDELVDATNPQRLVYIIQGLGYRAELTTDDVGDPMINSTVGGTSFSIIFYGCDQDSHQDCDLLLYKVGYDMNEGVDLEVVNEWNATQLVGRAYRDDVDDPWLEMSWNLKGGVTVSNFESTFEWWELSVGKFESHIGF